MPRSRQGSGSESCSRTERVDPSRVLSCGDALNDIPMFEYCGYSVAVNSGLRQVVEVADWLTESDGLEGTIELLRALLNII